MSTVLVLTSSALGAASVSNQLVQDAIALLRLQDPHLRVITRDLGGNPIPHLTVESATALRGAEPANSTQAATRALSDELIAELKAADTLVVGAPMYNFGIASTLKTWFDHVLRAGITFKYSESGPVCSATIWMGTQRQSGWPFRRSRQEDDCRGPTITQAIFA